LSIGRHIEQALQTLKILSVKIKEIDYDITNEHEVTSLGIFCIHFLDTNCIIKHTEANSLCRISFITFFQSYFYQFCYYALNRIKTRLERIREDSTAEAFNTVQFEVGKILSKFQYSKPDVQDGRNCFFIWKI
jgi:uncharacterized alpha-E superfamily protein